MPIDRLQRRLAKLQFPLDDDALAEVKQCVCEYVDLARAENWPPERVLVGLKRIAEEAGIRSKSLHTYESRASRSDLLMDMVAWSIERYYRDTAGS